MIHRQPAFAGLIGVARADITPPPAILARNWGAAAHEVADGVHRPLTLTGLALRDSPAGPPLLLLAADLGWWRSRADEQFVREGLRAAVGLDATRCLMCLSHTHAGPSLGRDDAGRPGGGLIAAYLEQVREAAIAVARAALAGMRPATLTWRYGRCDLACHRDLPEPGGGRLVVGFNPGRPADDTLLVGRVTDEAGAVVATLVNYACHPTTLGWGNRQLSPDYPGAMRELVEQATGGPCLFLQGASGELAPAEQYRADPALADAHGRRLGHAVLATLAGMLPPGTCLAMRRVLESGAPLALWEREPHLPSIGLAAAGCEVVLPLKPMPTVAQLAAAVERASDRVAQERLRRELAVRRNVGEGTALATTLCGWRLGEALLFAHPHEAYSAFQLELRAHFAPRPVVAVNIANGYASYLPPRAAYAEGGLYAVNVSPFLAGGLEQLTAAAVTLGSRLAAGGDGA